MFELGGGGLRCGVLVLGLQARLSDRRPDSCRHHLNVPNIPRN